MGFVFNKRIQLLPFLAINISKSGISWSIGKKGANINVGADGVRLSTGINGTGVGYRKQMGLFKLPRLTFFIVSALIVGAILLWLRYTGQDWPHTIKQVLQLLAQTQH